MRPENGRHSPVSRRAAAALAATALIGFVLSTSTLVACGPFFPNNLLARGDDAVLVAPELCFSLEMQRLNLGHSRFKAVPVRFGDYTEQSLEADLSDLQIALKAAGVRAEEAEQILQAHREEREKLRAYINAASYCTSRAHPGVETDAVPPNFPSIAIVAGLPDEFADYLAGSMAWHNPTVPDKNVARKLWERLLERPAPQRKFKSTWAAYMLGKSWEESDPDKAAEYYQKVRAFCSQGFRDSIGLAAASLGREAKIYLGQKKFEPALQLYLQQLGTGDPSATNSLRFASAAALRGPPEMLGVLAKNPLTQRVITAYLAAEGPWTPGSFDGNASEQEASEHSRAWLEAVEVAKVRDVDSAEKLALAAYQRNEMETAQRWIQRAPSGAVAQWLKAKLLLRAGKLREAAALLARVAQAFPVEAQGTNQVVPSSLKETLFVQIYDDTPGSLNASRQVLGELGALRLARREYVQSLDALLNSGFWMDAAYVAERVLTLEELQSYVDSHWPAVSAAQAAEEKAEFGEDPVSPSTLREHIRYLLARRLMRASRGEEARTYYPTQWQPSCDRLLSALGSGWNQAVPQEERARALFEAAVITRTNGMELMGTEVEPDWHFHDGQFEEGVTAADRATNECARTLIPAEDELHRSAAHHPDPECRFHYRFQAASLAWEAAKLMPDNSDETARVLCVAGSWLKYQAPKTADVFYKALVLRNRKTTLGAEADVLRWFPVLDETGNIIVHKVNPATLEVVTKPNIPLAEPESAENESKAGESEESTDTAGREVAQAGGFSESAAPQPSSDELGYRYIVHAGDTFSSIARRFTEAGVPITTADIRAANSLQSYRLMVGQALWIPLHKN